MYKSVVHPLAKQDLKEAATWYNDRQSGLGKRFTAHTRKTVQHICKNPKAIVIRYDNIRVALLETFPYMIHFSVDDDKKLIIILAVLHMARDPKSWKERE